MWTFLEYVATYVMIDATALPWIQDSVVGLVTQLQAA
jgi:hypothetical protein